MMAYRDTDQTNTGNFSSIIGKDQQSRPTRTWRETNQRLATQHYHLQNAYSKNISSLIVKRVICEYRRYTKLR